MIPGVHADGVHFRVDDQGPGAQDLVIEGAVDDFALRGFSRDVQGEVGGVDATGGIATLVAWDAVPGGPGLVYDVARGDLAALGGGGGGVTLGALSVSRGEINGRRGSKRHPTIEDDVTIYAGASIHGGETVIGRGSVIGGNVWLTKSVPAGSKIFGRAK